MTQDSAFLGKAKSMAVSAFSWDGITVGFQLPTAEKDLNPKTPTLLWTSNLDYYVITHEKPFFCHQLRQFRRAHRMCRILEEISLWWHGLLFAFQMALGKRPCTQAIGSARKGLLEMPRSTVKGIWKRVDPKSEMLMPLSAPN